MAFEGLDHRRLAAEKDAGVLDFKRLEAAVRRAVRLVFWRPGKKAGIETSLFEPALEPGQAARGESDMRLHGLVRRESAKEPMIALAEVPFVAGNTFSAADITALVTVDFATKAMSFSAPGEHAALERWYENVSSRPSVEA
jgi:glutathione S-transferase